MAFSPGTTEALITFTLGGGAIAMVTQLVRASRLWRTGRLATTREVIRDMAAARDEAEEREEEQRADAMYWQSIAAGYTYQLRQAGIIPDPLAPEAPSAVKRRKTKAAAREKRQRQRDRADLAPSTEEIEAIMDDTDPRLGG